MRDLRYKVQVDSQKHLIVSDYSRLFNSSPNSIFAGVKTMFRKRVLPILALLAVGVVASIYPVAHAQDFSGRAGYVQSGDTFVVSVYGRPWRVKVDGVTATAPGTTPRAARAALASLVSGRQVSVSQVATENDGRIRARVTVGNTDIASALLSRGTVISGNVDSPLAEPAMMKTSSRRATRTVKGKGKAGAASAAGTLDERQGTGNIRVEEVRNYLGKIQETKVKNY
jgi:hypothetical protein